MKTYLFMTYFDNITVTFEQTASRPHKCSRFLKKIFDHSINFELRCSLTYSHTSLMKPKTFNFVKIKSSHPLVLNMITQRILFQTNFQQLVSNTLSTNMRNVDTINYHPNLNVINYPFTCDIIQHCHNSVRCISGS